MEDRYSKSPTATRICHPTTRTWIEREGYWRTRSPELIPTIVESPALTSPTAPRARDISSHVLIRVHSVSRQIYAVVMQKSRHLVMMMKSVRTKEEKKKNRSDRHEEVSQPDRQTVTDRQTDRHGKARSSATYCTLQSAAPTGPSP